MLAPIGEPDALDIRLEKRLSPRRNTMIDAVIAYDGGRTPCVIRNLSESGAKLEFTTGIAKIPKTFDLLVPKVRPQPCVVVWRSLKELGVQFQNSVIR